jgi:hypothetical protein
MNIYFKVVGSATLYSVAQGRGKRSMARLVGLCGRASEPCLEAFIWAGPLTVAVQKPSGWTGFHSNSGPRSW